MPKVASWLGLPFLILMLACPPKLQGQTPNGGAAHACSMVYDQTTVLDGNNIRTLLTNRGTVSAPSDSSNDLVWKTVEKGQGFEFGLFAAGSVSLPGGGLERIVSDGLHSRKRSRPPGWEPQSCVDGKLVLRPRSEMIPTNDKPSSWPDNWFVDSLRGSFWPGDQELGSSVADREARFYMNDYRNTGYEYRPSGSDDSMRGLGLEVASRVYQWTADSLADALVLEYDITNRSLFTIDSLVIGMWGDPHIQGRYDFEDDVASFDTTIGLLIASDPDSLTFLSIQAYGTGSGYLHAVALPYSKAIALSDDALWSQLIFGPTASFPSKVGDQVFLFRSKPLSLPPGEGTRLKVVLRFAENPETLGTGSDNCRLDPDFDRACQGREPDPEPPKKPPKAGFFTVTDSLLTVRFNDTTVDPDSVVARRIWDFGDLDEGKGPSPTHRYDAAGTYRVVLALWDSTKIVGADTQHVTVTMPNPNGHCTCPKILAVGLDSIFAEADLSSLVKKFGLSSLLQHVRQDSVLDDGDLISVLESFGLRAIMDTVAARDLGFGLNQNLAFAELDRQSRRAALDSLAMRKGIAWLIGKLGLGSVLEELEHSKAVATEKLTSIRSALDSTQSVAKGQAITQVDWLFNQLEDQENWTRHTVETVLARVTLQAYSDKIGLHDLLSPLEIEGSPDSLGHVILQMGLKRLADRLGLPYGLNASSLRSAIEWVGLSSALDDLPVDRESVTGRLDSVLATFQIDSLFARFGLDEIRKQVNVDSMLAAIGLDVVPATFNRLRDAARGVTSTREIVKARDFLRDAASSSVSTLERAAGVEVTNIGPNQQHVSLGGLGMPLDGRPLVLVDHRRGAIPGLGANVFAVLPIAAIDLKEAEIARGNGFVDYGPDSDDGFIHFQTKSPFEYPGTDMSVGLGESSLAQTAVRYADTLSSRFGYKFVGSYTTANDSSLLDFVNHNENVADRLDSYFDGRGEKTWSTYLRGSALYKPCDCLLLTANADVAAAKINLIDTDGGLFLDDFRVASGQLMLESPLLFAQAYYTHADPGNSVTESLLPFTDNAQMFAAQVRYRVGTIPMLKRFVPKEFMLGMDYASTSLPDESFPNPSANQAAVTGKVSQAMLSASDRGNVTERAIVADVGIPLPFAKIRAGNRIEFDDLTDETRWLSPRISLSGEPVEEHHLTLSYNRSFSLNANAAFFRDAYFNADAKYDANPDVAKDLPDSYTRMWQLIYRYTGVRNGFVEVNTFHLRKEEAIPAPIFAVGDVIVDLNGESGFEQPVADALVPYVNIAYWGADLRFDLRGGYRTNDRFGGVSPTWRVQASGSWLSDNFFRGQELDRVLEQFVTTLDVPRIRFRVGYERELSSGTWFSIAARYSGAYDVWYGSRRGRIAEHLLVDVSVSQPLGSNTLLTLTGRNLGNDEHREFPMAPSVGRYLSARLTHHLN